MTRRTCGSVRKKHRLQRYTRTMEQLGVRVASVNVAGVTVFKLFMLLEHLTADIICLQETWLQHGVDLLPVPGFKWYE